MVTVVPATVVAVDTVARVVNVLVAMIFLINLRIILDVRIVSVVAKVVKLDCILKRGKNRLVVMGGKIVKRVKKTKTWIINIKIGPPVSTYWYVLYFFFFICRKIIFNNNFYFFQERETRCFWILS